MTVAGIISALAVGLIIGALGHLALPGRQQVPIWLTILIGVGAALLGTVIARAARVAATTSFDWWETGIQIVVATIGVALTAGYTNRHGVTR